MNGSEGRRARLVLVTAGGEALGSLPALDLALPWWQEAADVVAAARETYGLAVVVLRMLHAERPAPHGGEVSYAAEVDPARIPTELALQPLVGADLAALAPDPLRLPWAAPGGPAASLAWAEQELERVGLARAVMPQQQRSWNLSALWRYVDASGETLAWLKQVPPFFGHEAALLGWLDRVRPGFAPRPLAAGPLGRELLAAAPGTDRYAAGLDERLGYLERLVALQVEAAVDVGSLVGIGVPDRRGALLAAWLRGGLERFLGPDAAQAALASAGPSLEADLEDVEACGIPATLVHGDFHPGNVVADGERATVLDWGDASVGQPGWDALTMAYPLDAAERRTVLDRWTALWREAVPGCEPERALGIQARVRPLLAAATYAWFCVQIEPSERAFHADDVARELAAAQGQAVP